MRTQYLALVSLILLIHSVSSYKSKSKKDQCKTCNDLVQNFIKGFKKTSKGNFGGGNTDWEDRKLGSYVTSDIRFEEIVERLCSDKENECQYLLEEQEDNLLDWFKTKQNRIELELFDNICIDSAKVCCPKSHYGPNCEPCPTFNDQICYGNGLCDGEGTRDGNGKCNCHASYAGKDCFSCNIGYYEESKNATHLKCNECYRACQTCTNSESTSCLSCKSGWTFNSETKLCEDVNECLQDKTCRSKEYCENRDGSYSCIDCNAACTDACSGPGADKCVGKCNKGYEKIPNSEGCVDINECELNPHICSNENYECINKPGTYDCKAKFPENSSSNSQSSSASDKKDDNDDGEEESEEDFDDEL